MTEAASVYYADIREKADVKKSSLCKKNGPNTSKLGNRRLTWQEIAERHGEVKTYSLESFLSFSEFKELPKDLQIEYVNKLCDKYDINIKHVSRYLFNIGDEGLQSHLRINDILKKCNPDKKRQKTGLEQFQIDIDRSKKGYSEPEEAFLYPPLMSYVDFKKLELDDQINFVNTLIGYYKIGIATISQILFHKSDSNLDMYFRSRKVNDRIKKCTANANACAANKKAFKTVVDAWEKNSQEPTAEVCNDDSFVKGFIAYETYTTYKPTTRLAYINWLSEKYHVGQSTISKVLFEKDASTLNNYFHAHKLDKDLLRGSSGKTASANNKIFKEAVYEWKGIQNPSVDEIPEEPEKTEDAKEVTPVIDISEEAKKEEVVMPVEEIVAMEPAVEEDPIYYHDISFRSSYIRKGLDVDEFSALNALFKNKRVKVEITITEV